MTSVEIAKQPTVAIRSKGTSNALVVFLEEMQLGY